MCGNETIRFIHRRNFQPKLAWDKVLFEVRCKVCRSYFDFKVNLSQLLPRKKPVTFTKLRPWIVWVHQAGPDEAFMYNSTMVAGNGNTFEGNNDPVEQRAKSHWRCLALTNLDNPHFVRGLGTAAETNFALVMAENLITGEVRMSKEFLKDALRNSAEIAALPCPEKEYWAAEIERRKAKQCKTN